MSAIPELSIPTPKTPIKGRNTTRDERIRIQTLFFEANWGISSIALQLNLTPDQVRYAIRHRLTPQKTHSGRRPLLGPAERKQLIEWVCAGKQNRRTSWKLIPGIFGWHCTEYAIATAFKKEGFARYSAVRKPKLTDQQARIRLEWAEEHKNWTEEQWFQILWTDETWVQPGRHRKVKVTRRKGEKLHKDCVEPRVQRKIGWMFWGSISGLGKGPSIFWEKQWGGIGSTSYCEHIVPVIADYIGRTGLVLMQDNASGHTAKNTLAYMAQKGLYPIFWPANSPDLNPIEDMWEKMKDYIEEHYPEIHRSYPKLRATVIEAWNAIAHEHVLDLIRSMPDRCRAVIKAEGWHTEY